MPNFTVVPLQVSVHVPLLKVAVQPAACATDCVCDVFQPKLMSVPWLTDGALGALRLATVESRPVALATVALLFNGSAVTVFLIESDFPLGAWIPLHGWAGAEAEL